MLRAPLSTHWLRYGMTGADAKNSGTNGRCNLETRPRRLVRTAQTNPPVQQQSNEDGVSSAPSRYCENQARGVPVEWPAGRYSGAPCSPRRGRALVRKEGLKGECGCATACDDWLGSGAGSGGAAGMWGRSIPHAQHPGLNHRDHSRTGSHGNALRRDNPHARPF